MTDWQPRTMHAGRRGTALAHYLPRFVCCAQMLCSLSLSRCRVSSLHNASGCSRRTRPRGASLKKGEMTRNALQFIRSGRHVRVERFSPRTTLLDWLRLEERSPGTKEGCAEGDCGAGAVVVARERDGSLVYEPVNACITLLGQIDGGELITVEDLAEKGLLHPIQEA